MTELYFDTETTTRNHGHPFTRENKLISYVTLTPEMGATFNYYRDPGFTTGFVDDLHKADELVGFNIKFDLHWAYRHGYIATPKQRIWDCMLAEYVLSGQESGFISLNETLKSYGLEPKLDQVSAYWAAGIDTDDIPVHILQEYNTYDVEGLVPLKRLQQEAMTEEQIALVYLMGEDMLTLIHAEQAGIKWNESKADGNIAKLREELSDIESRLSTYLPSLPGNITFNWDSGDQLSALLYGATISFDYPVAEPAIYKSGPNKGATYTKNKWFTEKVSFPKHFEPLERTALKKCTAPFYDGPLFYKTDAPTLAKLKTKDKSSKILLDLLKDRSEKIKVVEMVQSIQERIRTMGWTDNFIHGAFNQVAVITGRLSSSGPNLQNTPPEVDELLTSRYAS